MAALFRYSIQKTVNNDSSPEELRWKFRRREIQNNFTNGCLRCLTNNKADEEHVRTAKTVLLKPSKFVDLVTISAVLKIIQLIHSFMLRALCFCFFCSTSLHPQLKYLMTCRPLDIYSQNYCSGYLNKIKSLKLTLFQKKTRK